MVRLQRIAYKAFPDDLREFALSNVGSIDTREGLLEHLSDLSDDKLHELCALLHLVPPREAETDGSTTPSRTLLIELLVFKYERRLSQIEALNDMPL